MDKLYQVTLERILFQSPSPGDQYFIRSLKGIRALTPDMTGLPEEVGAGSVVGPDGIDYLLRKRSSSTEVVLLAGDAKKPQITLEAGVSAVGGNLSGGYWIKGMTECREIFDPVTQTTLHLGDALTVEQIDAMLASPQSERVSIFVPADYRPPV